jgi:hypothetical protein
MEMSTFWAPNAISQGPKKSRFPGPNPLPLALVMYLPASKALRTGPLIEVTVNSKEDNS